MAVKQWLLSSLLNKNFTRTAKRTVFIYYYYYYTALHHITCCRAAGELSALPSSVGAAASSVGTLT